MTTDVEGDWEKEFDEKWRILRPPHEVLPEQEIAFEQHDRKLGEIKFFISQLLLSRDEYWKEQEMGAADDCWRHAEIARERGTKEGAQRFKEKVVAVMENYLRGRLLVQVSVEDITRLIQETEI